MSLEGGGGGGASEVTNDENYFENWIATRQLELILDEDLIRDKISVGC